MLTSSILVDYWEKYQNKKIPCNVLIFRSILHLQPLKEYVQKSSDISSRILQNSYICLALSRLYFPPLDLFSYPCQESVIFLFSIPFALVVWCLVFSEVECWNCVDLESATAVQLRHCGNFYSSTFDTAKTAWQTAWSERKISPSKLDNITFSVLFSSSTSVLFLN